MDGVVVSAPRHLHELRATLTVNGTTLPVVSGSVTEDWWAVPGVVGNVRCSLPTVWSASQYDAARVLAATLTLRWYGPTGAAVGSAVSWKLLVRTSSLDVATNEGDFELVSTDYVLTRPLTDTHSLTYFEGAGGGDGLIIDAVSALLNSEYAGYAARLGISVVAPSVAYKVPLPTGIFAGTPTTGAAFLDMITQPFGCKWRVNRAGNWTLVAREEGVRATGPLLTTAVPTVGTWNTTFAGLTVAQWNTLFAGKTVGDVNAYLAATADAEGTVTAARLTSSLDRFANSVVATFDDSGSALGLTATAEAGTATLGRFAATFSSPGDYADSVEQGRMQARARLAVTRRAGYATEVEALADLTVTSSSWVRIRARKDVRSEQVQAVTFEFPTGRMRLTTRPPTPED